MTSLEGLFRAKAVVTREALQRQLRSGHLDDDWSMGLVVIT